jgi:hypothetical protein
MRKNNLSKLCFVLLGLNVSKTDIGLWQWTFGHKFEVDNTEMNISRTYARE